VKKRTLSLAVASLLIGLNAASVMAAGKSYVISAPQWNQAQEEAVRAAGGSVIYGHNGTGLGIVESEAPDFAARLMASGLVTEVNEDKAVRWQDPVQEVLVEESAVNPNDEAFYRYIQWAPQAIEAPAAWAAGYTGRGVRVAIVDGGIHSTHLDLKDNLDVAASRSFVPGFAFNQDTSSHATHVAGIVAAADNDIGTIGIAPEATLIGVKVLQDGTGTFGQIIAGIYYAVTPRDQGGAGADIVNLSLGATFDRAGGNGPLVAAFNKAVNYANRSGVLVVSSAGNDATDLDHNGSLIKVPAQSGSGIAVSATGPRGFGFHEASAVYSSNGNLISVAPPADATNYRRIASYTNYGNSVITVAAPGGDYTYSGSEYCYKARIPSSYLT
jgi:subtilisin family serine protease